MSHPYRNGQPRTDDEPVPDFGNRPSVFGMMPLALCVSALMGAASWHDFHDAWLSPFLTAPVVLVVAAIALLQAPLRRWRARRDACAVAAGVDALEAKVATLPPRA